MKKYLSVFKLIVRSSIYPVTGVLLGTAFAGGALLFVTGWKEPDLYRAVFHYLSLIIGLVLLWAILERSLCRNGGQLSYTMRRLRISDKTVFWMQAGYNGVCFALYYMVHALVLVAFSAVYLNAHPEASHQTLFVTAYQYEIFHMIFPLENAVGWVCNFVLIAGLGICTAAYPFRQRRGRRSISTYMMVMTVIFYQFLMAEDHHLGLTAAVYCIPATLLITSVSIAGVLGIEEEVYE